MKTIKSTSSLLGAFILAFGIFAAASVAHAKDETRTAKAETYAVLFYADWCGSCKVIDPKLKEARESLDEGPALFVTFDMTDDKTKNQTALLASAIGLQKLYQENEGRTGFLLVIDAESKEVVDRITTEDSTQAIKTKIASATRS